MGEKALVESIVADSMEFVKELDAHGTPPVSAVWHYYSDAEQWKLLIAGPDLDKLLPKQEAEAYMQLVRALSNRGLSSLTIGDVKAVRTDNPLVIAVRTLIQTAPGALVRAHFSNTTLNGIFIEEMLILRSA